MIAFGINKVIVASSSVNLLNTGYYTMTKPTGTSFSKYYTVQLTNEFAVLYA